MLAAFRMDQPRYGGWAASTSGDSEAAGLGRHRDAGIKTRRPFLASNPTVGDDIPRSRAGGRPSPTSPAVRRWGFRLRARSEKEVGGHQVGRHVVSQSVGLPLKAVRSAVAGWYPIGAQQPSDGLAHAGWAPRRLCRQAPLHPPTGGDNSSPPWPNLGNPPENMI